MLALGFDIGGSNLKVVLMENKKIREKRIDTLPENFISLLQLIEKIYADWSRSYGKPKKIGLALAALCDSKGKVLMAPNIPYLKGKNLREQIAKKTGIKKIVLLHDSHAFLRAELALNSKLKSRNILLVALGTGIGGAFTVDGRINAGWSGEIGKMVLDVKSGRSLEQLGGSQFIKTALKATSVLEAKRRAAGGNVKAKATFEEMGANLAVGLAGAVNLLGSDKVVLTGGLTETKKFWLKKFNQNFKANLITPRRNKIKVLISANSMFGAAIGSII
jgi:predicted NBD/HSP70 family sugar kinase